MDGNIIGTPIFKEILGKKSYDSLEIAENDKNYKYLF